MNNDGKVVVTGGAGFIGSELVRQLAAEGRPVTVVDNLVNGTASNVEGVGGVDLRVDDIRDRVAVDQAVDGAEIVYHLACLGVRHSLHDPVENQDVNAVGTLTMLLAARDAGVGRFVYVSSSEVYGTAMHVPMSELHPTFPMTVYGAGKLAGECYTRAFHRSYGYPTVVVRPFNSFGPRSHHEGDSGEVIPKFVLRALAGKELVIFGDGTQTRDFTFVSDTARGIRAAGVVAAAVGGTFNLGQGTEITVNELAETVSAVVGRATRVVHDDDRPGDVLRLYSDSTHAQDVLGFRPTVSLEDGLRQLLGWYQASGRSPEELLEAERVRNWVAPDTGTGVP